MKNVIVWAVAAVLIISCNNTSRKDTNVGGASQALAKLFDNYWEEHLQLFPLEATAIGDPRYNDKLTITIAQSFRDSLGHFYFRYLTEISKIDSNSLTSAERISIDLFKYEMQMGIEGLEYPTHYLPINQFWAFTLDLPQLGSGKGNQPFKTVKDYDDFLKRLSVFPAWADTAIYNMRKGMDTGWVLPQKLVVKVLPQLKAIVVKDPKQSIFYGPITDMPGSFSSADKERLTVAYAKVIDSVVSPTYARLHDFFEKEYLPKARSTSGISAVQGGDKYYAYCSRYWTTTSLSPDSIYHLGLKEVERLTSEMNRIKDETGFKGDLHAFFEYLNKDRRFFPFSKPEQVLDSFWAIKKQEDPQLKRLFNYVPKAGFTIRQTEAFRAASASPEYNPGSEDGTRPGIFYVPIIDPKKFNGVGMETLFLHEAIPGHHYQGALQQENKGIPKFRRFLWYGAYGEGWALYSESLGKELGLYNNPYQYFGHLSDAIHRAIRLVVDVGIHYKGMTREEAIKYMMEHERTSEEEATAEIERYMAIPGQALSYKIGAYTIRAERTKYEQALGKNFNVASFHDEVLSDGCVPLRVLQDKLAEWAKKQ